MSVGGRNNAFIWRTTHGCRKCKLNKKISLKAFCLWNLTVQHFYHKQSGLNVVRGMKWYWNKVNEFFRKVNFLCTDFTFIIKMGLFLLTNQNYIQEEIKCRLKAGNSCYYSVQTLLSSGLLSKNLKIKIYKTIILPVVLYGCEAWSLTLKPLKWPLSYTASDVLWVDIQRRKRLTG